MDYVINKRGLKIAVGSRVRYIGTGTIGVVKAINLADGRYWALLDATNLYYDAEYLELLSETSVKREVSPGTKEEGVVLVKVKEDKDIEKATEVTPSGAG